MGRALSKGAWAGAQRVREAGWHGGVRWVQEFFGPGADMPCPRQGSADAPWRNARLDTLMGFLSGSFVLANWYPFA